MKTKFDKIYILHYLPMKDRDIALQKKFKYLGLKYEYIYALPLNDIFESPNIENVFNITNKNNFWKHGEKCIQHWSVAFGHYMCVYQAYHLGYNSVLVLEDDVCMNKDNSWKYGEKCIQHWSVAFGHYMCVYQAYYLGFNNVLILENDVVINTDKDLIFRYLYDIPEDADIIRYGYMEWDEYNIDKFDNTNELFYKDNENSDTRYYGNQCYGLMNRKTMKIYLDSCNYIFYGNEDVKNIHRGNEYNLNIYYATKPIFLDHIAYHKIYNEYVLPYSKKLINKYTFME